MSLIIPLQFFILVHMTMPLCHTLCRHSSETQTHHTGCLFHVFIFTGVSHASLHPSTSFRPFIVCSLMLQTIKELRGSRCEKYMCVHAHVSHDPHYVHVLPCVYWTCRWAFTEKYYEWSLYCNSVYTDGESELTYWSFFIYPHLIYSFFSHQ